ncbi:hypothetical protein GGR07_001762 [Bacteroides pyogenes]|nr:hypothetical protein [Bacteroides pyogenes]SUV32976.1 Uncharacterised protein [Bacteroides pyogenes]
MVTAQYLYRKNDKRDRKHHADKESPGLQKKPHPVIGKDLFHDNKDSVKP